jgi:hypothetical protein
MESFCMGMGVRRAGGSILGLGWDGGASSCLSSLLPVFVDATEDHKPKKIEIAIAQSNTLVRPFMYILKWHTYSLYVLLYFSALASSHTIV